MNTYKKECLTNQLLENKLLINNHCIRSHPGYVDNSRELSILGLMVSNFLTTVFSPLLLYLQFYIHYDNADKQSKFEQIPCFVVEQSLWKFQFS